MQSYWDLLPLDIQGVILQYKRKLDLIETKKVLTKHLIGLQQEIEQDELHTNVLMELVYATSNVEIL